MTVKSSNFGKGILDTTISPWYELNKAVRMTFQATYTHNTIIAINRRHVHTERRLGTEHTWYWHSIGQHFKFTFVLFYSILVHTLSVHKYDQHKQCLQKGKVHPITCHEGTKGVWRYRSALSLTWALYGGGWLTPRPGGFTPGNNPLPIV
jgi:hypothetical protein